jgi:hypothetical protein
MKIWNRSGLKTSLSRGRKIETLSESTFKIGGIPIIDRWLANQRIRGREQSIKKIEDKVKDLVTKEHQKIDSVIDFAKRTDIKTVYDRALALRDKLEDAACTKIKFSDRDDDEVDVPSKPGRPAKAEPKNVICIKGIAGALFINGSHGKVVGKGSAQTFKPNSAGLNIYVDDCVKNGGKTTLPDVTVSTFTGGAKTGDVSIDVSSEF